MLTDTTTTTTQASQMMCLECSRGMAMTSTIDIYNYWSYGLDFCQPCKPGYYANRTGADLCEKCPAGYSCAEPSQDPKPCPKGFYCPPQALITIYLIYFEVNIPIPCPQDTYASKEASTDCLSCPAGYDCADPTNPVKCPKGF